MKYVRTFNLCLLIGAGLAALDCFSPTLAAQTTGSDKHPFSDAIALSQAVQANNEPAANAVLGKYEPGLTLKTLRQGSGYPYLNQLANPPRMNALGGGFLGDSGLGTGGVAAWISGLAQEATGEQALDTIRGIFEDHKELQQLFPSTYAYLKQHPRITSFQDALTNLKPKVRADLEDLPDGLKDFAETFDQTPDDHLRTYAIEAVLAAANSAAHKQGLPAAIEVLADAGITYANKADKADGPGVKQLNAVIGFAGFSSRALATDDGQGWHTSGEMKQAVQIPNFPLALLGLTYLQDQTASVTLLAHGSPGPNLDLTKVVPPEQLGRAMAWLEVMENVAGYAESFRSGGNRAKAEAITNFLSTLNQKIGPAIAAHLTKLDQAQLKTIENIFGSLAAAMNCYNDVVDHNYGDAANDLGTLVSYWITSEDANKNSKTIAFVTKLSLFLSQLAEAKSPQDQAALIRSVAPSGDTTLKFRTKSLWSFEVYGGVGVGMTRVYGDSTGLRSARVTTSLSPVAQLGLEYSHGFLTEKPKTPGATEEAATNAKKASEWGIGSVSLFLPVVDLGAMSAYDITHSNPAPDTSWSNVFAPGAYLMLGIRHPPLLFIPRDRLRIGFGGQYGPRLQKVDTVNGNTLIRRAWQAPKLEISIDLWTFSLTGRAADN